MKILDQIITEKKSEIKTLRTRFQLRDFGDSVYYNRPVRSLSQALRQSQHLAIIAEIKKASPSAGIIRADFDPQKIAGDYEANGAAAVSVLTDQKFFQGHIDHLRQLAAGCNLPLLRKDFILDEYQVFEARAAGADAILLIAEILSVNQITELTQAASTVNLEVLLEMHSTEQLKKIDYMKNRLVGINNRNLDSLSVNTDTAIQIKELLPADIVTVAESGIHEKSQLEKIKKSGIDAILVGEHLLRAENPGRALKKLREWCRYAD